MGREKQAARILLVEDDESFTVLVRAYLRAMAADGSPPLATLPQYTGMPTLDAVGTLAAARERLIAQHYDLVLLDLHLPDSAGLDTLRAIRAAGERIIVVMTADDDPGLPMLALEHGAYDFMAKGRMEQGELRRVVRLATLQAAAMSSLRESEARFRSLAELIADVYWEQDEELRFTSFTGRRAYENPDFASPALMGRRRWETDYINMSSADWARHKAVLEAREPFHDLELCRISGGRQLWVSTSGTPVFDHGGRFRGYRGVGQDITRRKREDQLRALEQSVSRALAQAESPSFALRAVIQAICEAERWPCGRFFGVDEAAGLLRCVETWGVADAAIQAFLVHSRDTVYRPGQGLSGTVWRSGRPLWVSDTSHDPRASHTAAGTGLKGGAFVFPVIAEGRTIGVLSFTSKDVRAPDDHLIQAIGLIGTQVGQVLKRIVAEGARRELEQRFRETFELAGSGIAHVDLDGRLLRANPQLRRMLGYSAEELIGRSVKDISHPADRDVTDGPRARVRAGELDSAHFEKRYVRKDGSVMWVDLTVALARDETGQPLYEIAVVEDITERRRVQEELRRFRIAMDASADMIFLIDRHSMRYVDVNATASRVLGYSREEFLAMGPQMILPFAREELERAYDALIADPRSPNSVTSHYRCKDGSLLPFESTRRVLRSGEQCIIAAISRDISERRHAEEHRAAQARYQKRIAGFGEAALAKRDAEELVALALRSVLEGLGGGVAAYVERRPSGREVLLRQVDGLSVDPAGTVVEYRADGPLGRTLDAGEAASGRLPFEWAAGRTALFAPVAHETGARAALCALPDAGKTLGAEEARFLAAAASVLSAGLKRIESESRLAYLAQFDALTGLPNRALLSDRFAQLIAGAKRRGAPLSVLFVDLDEFKLVNDTLGHAGGDELLKEVAARLHSCVRSGDTVARISGDEFAVLLADMAKPEDAGLVAQKIIDRLGEPFHIQGKEVFVTASIGIAAFPADGADAETLIGAADAAMYRAKQSGRNAYQFFTAEIERRTRARALLGGELRRALEREEFRLVYQPKFDLKTDRPSGAEALLRWQHPTRGVVSPADFIPILEESGLIVPVGEWVLRQACTDIRAWESQGVKPFPVAVNLSARQFRQLDLAARMRSIVSAAGIASHLIELEITESQLMQDPDHAIRAMRSLVEAGIRIVIDDFGTGYSSLAYLTRFPLSALKIDRSFVAGVLDHAGDATIVRTIIEMAHTLGFAVIAEGVENAGQKHFLRGLGCEQAQGFLFSRPISAESMAEMLGSNPPRVRKVRV